MKIKKYTIKRKASSLQNNITIDTGAYVLGNTASTHSYMWSQGSTVTINNSGLQINGMDISQEIIDLQIANGNAATLISDLEAKILNLETELNSRNVDIALLQGKVNDLDNFKMHFERFKYMLDHVYNFHPTTFYKFDLLDKMIEERENLDRENAERKV